MSSAYEQGLECYAARYEDLLKGYCAGDLRHCDWKGLREHHAEHGKAEGRIKSCRAWDTQCYAMRYPDLRRGYCRSGSAALDCDWLPLLRHWSSAGRAQGMQLDCETPELLCYAGRYPDLRSSFCSGGDGTVSNDLSDCNWPKVLEFMLGEGQEEGRFVGCDPPTPRPPPARPQGVRLMRKS